MINKLAPILLLTLLAACSDTTTGAPRADGQPDPNPGPDTPDPNPEANPDPTPDPEPGQMCEDDGAFFMDSLWRPIMAARCAGCHSEGALAAETRFTLRDPSDPEGLAHDLAVLTTLSEDEIDGVSVLLLRPSGQHPDGHTGGALIAPGTPDYRTLNTLVGRLKGEVDDCNRRVDGEPDPMPGCETPETGPRLLRRLTHTELRNTLRDLLGIDVELESELAADNVVHGFDNNAEALTVSALLADQYRVLAEDLSQRAELGPLLSCPVNAGTNACALDFVTQFGRRAFRRPLTLEDKTRYMGLYSLVARDDGFVQGIRWMIAAMLQSPHFLYRTELGRQDGEGFRLTSWEIAASLSYLFWSTTPDDALIDKAATGALYDLEKIESEARRLLADPRSEPVVARFTDQWLSLGQLGFVTRDADLYPELTGEIREAMAGETARMVRSVWSSGGTMADLLLAEKTFATDALARFYGLEPGAGAADGQGFREIGLSEADRTGLLSQGSVLTTHALPTGSSPIHRGQLVRERLLCQELPPPPANLDTSPPPVDPTLSTRERYAQHASDPACSGCHDLVDPIGFAFEHFDAVGRWRPDDGGLAIDDSGFIAHSVLSDGAFEGVSGLAAHLAESPEVEACYLEMWLRYGTGQGEGLDVGCAVASLSEQYEAEGGRLDGAMLALTRAQGFVERRGEPGELDVPGGEILRPPGAGDPELNPSEDPELPSEPDVGPGDPPGEDTEDIEVRLEEQSRWDSGYCTNVTITNVSEGEVVWAVTVAVEGTINNAWNAERSSDEGRVQFRGVAWNATLAPGQTLDFGFCAAF